MRKQLLEDGALATLIALNATRENFFMLPPPRIHGSCHRLQKNEDKLRGKAGNEEARLLFSFGKLVPPARFQRATFRLGGGRSMQLSYGSTCWGIVSCKSSKTCNPVSDFHRM